MSYFIFVVYTLFHRIQIEDFCLAGAIIHCWLPQVFRLAFGHMEFREFQEADQNADPRIVETLSWHAINGKRLKSSLVFLECDDARWSVKLLSVSMEATRILIWFWLSCIGASLQRGQRPMLYRVLDPRTSVVVQALQHYSSLIMSRTGGGRLNLLWSSSAFNSFAEFCDRQQNRCRTIRRVLMLGAGWVFRRHFQYLNSDPFSLTLCGDHNAHADTLDNFLAFWTMKHPCCYPPGLCRDLKTMGLTPDDLCFGNCSRVLHWTAATVQLSIADIESMHSQNRVLQGSSFSSISAKYINSEALRIRDDARKLQFGEPENRQDLKTIGTSGGIKVRFKTRSPTAKGLSALELFRKHYLKLQSRGGKVNPCSKESWSDVREAFSSLSPHEMSLYEQLARDSKVEALAKRKVKKQIQKTKASQFLQKRSGDGNEGSANALVPHEQNHDGVHLQILPVHELRDLFQNAGEDVLSRVVKCHSKKNDQCFGKSDYPIGESTLEKVWRSQVQAGIDGKSACKTFQRQAESVARPETQDETFPDRVVHEGFCGEQCRHHSSSDRIAMRCNTLALFNYIVDQTLG